jgi:DNA-binding NtrC family response regulator
MKYKILIVDDEKSILDALYRALSGIEAKILTATDGVQALEIIKEQVPQIVVTDLRMPRMSGIQLMEEIVRFNKAIQMIVITGHGTIEDAVNAMKKGAYDFITKPFKKQQIVVVVQRALEKVKLLQENINLKEKLKKSRRSEFDWGKSREFKELLERSAQAAKSNATILIFGESGTGKEVLANYIFENSTRSDKTLVKINCAAIPDSLLEAELFGYKKGAFTGAVQDRVGKFRDAHNGTIFLDEVGEVPMSIQPKLLRVLQDGEITPIGGRT